MQLGRLVVVLFASGCSVGIGARAGASVSKTKDPVRLADPIDPSTTTTADATLSASWVDLEMTVGYSYLRLLTEVGGGQGGMRYRVMDTGLAHPIDGPKYDWFTARSAIGGALTTDSLIDPVRLVAYGLYNLPFGSQTNEVKSSLELGVRVELRSPFALDEDFSNTFDIGFAMLREKGDAEVQDLVSLGKSYAGEIETTGYLITFGWHFSIDDFLLVAPD